MKGTHLGEFEELVLLTVASLVNGGYSVAICDELSKHADRTVKLGVVHAVLNRLEEKGLVKSELGEATAFTTYGTIGVKCWIFKGEIIPQRRRQKAPAQPAR